MSDQNQGKNQNARSVMERAAAAAARDRQIVRTSIIGILANVLLAAFKAAVGMLSHSIAITLDAVNNLSDALSSVITILGTKLAAKPADKKHPLGYGRIEYISAMLISMLVLYAGITSFTESVKKILHPEAPDYSSAALIIVAAAVAVKIVLGRYVKGVGKRVNSDSLVNSGEDATLDSIISASTLVAAAIYLLCHVSLEAWLGAIIAVIIIKSGVEMLRDTLSQILGERIDSDIARKVKAAVCSVDGVHGAYDLILHAYGPDRYQGSVHIEIPDTYTADQIDKLSREIFDRVYSECGVLLTGIGVYAMNTKDDEAAALLTGVRELVMNTEYVLQMHGFYCDIPNRTLRFDVIVDFAAPDRQAVYAQVLDKVKEKYPDYDLRVNLDTDISD